MEWNKTIDSKVLNMLCDLGKESSESVNRFYHYTTLSGIKGIFSKYISDVNNDPNNSGKTKVNKCCLRASNVRFLNDTMEYKEGIHTLSQILDSIDSCEINENIYNISFCNNGNLLSQWDRYGKNSGIAIEFSFDDDLRIGYLIQNKKGVKESEAPCRWNYRPISVKYFNQEALYNKIKEEIDKQILSEGDDIAKTLFVPLCKNIGFEQEEESRIILYACALKNSSYNMDYIIDEEKGTVKPVLNVQMENKSGVNLIKSLTVGPGKNQNLIFNALVHMFDRRNYHFYDEDDPVYIGIKDVADFDKARIITEITEKDKNLYFGDVNGKLHFESIKNYSLMREIEQIQNCSDDIEESIRNSILHIINRENQKIIAERIKKQSDGFFIIHKCENGIFIKKSLIPYRA